MNSVSSLNTKFLKEKPYKVNFPSPAFLSFWQKLNLPTLALQYVCELVGRVMALETKKGLKHEDIVELDLIATMNACNLLLKLEGDDLLKMTRIKWEEHTKKTNLQTQHAFSQRIVNNIFRLQIDKEDIIASVISQTCFMRELDITIETYKYEEVASQLKKATDMFQHFRTWQAVADNPTILYQALKCKDMEILDTGEFSYNYEYFVRYMQGNKRVPTRTLVDAFRVLLKSLSVSVSDAPYTTQISATSLLHILKQTLTFYPIVDVEPLKQLYTDVSTLQKWPLPTGYLAREVTEMIEQEMRFPGGTLRAFLRQNISAIDFLLSDTEEMDSNIMNVVHCLIEDTIEIENIFTVNQNNAGATPNLESHQYRCMIIIHVFQTMSSLMNEKIAMHVVGLPIRYVFIVYCRLMNILDKCDDLSSVSDARSIQQAVFDDLINEILKISESNSSAKNIMQKMLKENSSYVPPAPNHQLKELGRTMLRIKDAKGFIEYEYTPRYERVVHIFASSKKPMMPLHEAPLKFCIIGGDLELHCFLQDLLKMFKEKPKEFLNCDYRVFLVPTKYCALAHFIAAKDAWYQRHVWLPFKVNPLVPRVADPLASKSKEEEMLNQFDKEKEVFPYVIKESIIQTYIREATIKYNPVIYEVLCYTNFPIDKHINPNLIVYCVSHIEIGAGVAAHKYRSEKRIPPETPYFEVDEHKGASKELSLRLKIGANYSEFSGYTHKNIDDVIDKEIHDLVINNVPREYMKTSLPIPNSGWLEMAYLETDNYKSLMKAYESKDKLKKLRGEQVSAAFSALYNQLHVSSVTISAEKTKGFDMVIDGKYYEQVFNTITVQPVESKGILKEKYFTLPVMTFFPIQA